MKILVTATVGLMNVKLQMGLFPIPDPLFSDEKSFLIPDPSTHGHDDALKLEVSSFLEKLNIKPIILHEQVNKGQTIIEKIESNTNVGFGIALYTSCDIGGKDKENLNNRARQNVVFEHGYLIGKLTRKRVVALVKEDSIETPGDMSGVVYISYNSNWQFDIAKELKSVGYDIDLNKLLN